MSAGSGIKRYDIRGLRALLQSWGEPSFRATQLLQWLYARGAQSYEEMSNLPASLRERMAADEPLTVLEPLRQQTSFDGTRKYLFGLADGLRIETVAIPRAKRLTVCFSTQVGCAMGCTFCSTGRGGLTRSLAPGEMVDQLIAVSKDLGQRVTNAVAMGEGEPFANYDATLAALRIINSPDGLGIGARHLTVSTCGLLRPLERFSHETDQFTLAVSLHSAVQATRDALMPALAQQPLVALREALALYGERTRRRPSLEVTLISHVNDTPSEVEALIGFARGMLCHVNLIPLSPPCPSPSDGIGPSDVGSSSPPERCAAVAAQLQAAGIECSVRRSRGADIGGACGQLKGLAEAPALCEGTT
jgi:23S rRNA (adenine2503-C2)-methyltransferase